MARNESDNVFTELGVITPSAAERLDPLGPASTLAGTIVEFIRVEGVDGIDMAWNIFDYEGEHYRGSIVELGDNGILALNDEETQIQ